MKKLIAALLALMLTMTAGFALADDLLQTVQSRGKMIFGTEGMWSPWTFHDEDDKLVGFDVEVAQKVCEKLGVTAEFAETEWDSIFAGIDAKRYDSAANGVEVTAERMEKYDFTTPYGYIRTALVVKGDNEDIHTFEDLKGKDTCNSLGSTYIELAESYGANTVGVDTLDETLEMVLAGRVDATLNAEVSVYDYLDVHPLADIKIVALTNEASSVAFPVRKDNPELLAAVNQAIDELRAEGVLSEISEKYFGKDITMPPEQ